MEFDLVLFGKVVIVAGASLGLVYAIFKSLDRLLSKDEGGN